MGPQSLIQYYDRMVPIALWRQDQLDSRGVELLINPLVLVMPEEGDIFSRYFKAGDVTVLELESYCAKGHWSQFITTTE